MQVKKPKHSLDLPPCDKIKSLVTGLHSQLSTCCTKFRTITKERVSGIGRDRRRCSLHQHLAPQIFEWGPICSCSFNSINIQCQTISSDAALVSSYRFSFQCSACSHAHFPSLHFRFQCSLPHLKEPTWLGGSCHPQQDPAQRGGTPYSQQNWGAPHLQQDPA